MNLLGLIRRFRFLLVSALMFSMCFSSFFIILTTSLDSHLYVTKWGSYGTGNGQFDLPLGIATDSSGNVYVTEKNNHRVQVFNSMGTYV